ncbi:ribosome-associated translation inhibitor RaiA [bacterium]|nr:ribosome-associated translation inhibitor RaiA [bacterium]
MSEDAKIVITHTFRGMDSSDAVKEYAEKRSSKISKHLHQHTNYQLTYSSEKNKFIAEVHVISGDFEAKAEASAETLYAAIDDVTGKILQQSRKFKEINSDHSGSSHHNQ